MLSAKLQKLHLKDKLTPHDVVAMFEELVEKYWNRKDYHKYLECSTLNSKKPLGSRLFETIAKLSVSVAFEAVCLRQNKKSGKIEIYLRQREPHESYTGQWHCPGSVFRTGEYPKDVLRRLARHEFKTNITIISPVGELFIADIRGWFLCKIYLVKCKEAPQSGKWWPVDKLPQNTVAGHRERIIPLALKAFKK